MCAAQAGKRGRSVLVLEHADAGRLVERVHAEPLRQIPVVEEQNLDTVLQPQLLHPLARQLRLVLR